MDCLIDQDAAALPRPGSFPVRPGVVPAFSVPSYDSPAANDRTEITALDEIERTAEPVIITILETDGDAPIGSRGAIAQPLKLVEVNRRWLLHENVVAMIEGGDRLIGVKVMRCTEMNRVDYPIAEELFQRRINAAFRRSVFRRERLSPRADWVNEPGDLNAVDSRQDGRMNFRDIATADNADVRKLLLCPLISP